MGGFKAQGWIPSNLIDNSYYDVGKTFEKSWNGFEKTHRSCCNIISKINKINKEINKVNKKKNSRKTFIKKLYI